MICKEFVHSYCTKSMIRLISILVLICFAQSIPSVGFSQSGKKAATNKTIYYFIDTDCQNCLVAGTSMPKLWVSSQIFTGSRQDQQVFIDKFKDKLLNQLSADSSLLSRVVFRWDDSEKNLEAAHTAKQAKMEISGYRVVKVEL